MILTLAALWFRPIGFDYRSKIENLYAQLEQISWQESE